MNIQISKASASTGGSIWRKFASIAPSRKITLAIKGPIFGSESLIMLERFAGAAEGGGVQQAAGGGRGGGGGGNIIYLKMISNR